MALIHSMQAHFSHNQEASPMWSGCMWVTITRRMGRPSSSFAKICSHCAFASSREMQQSTTVQPSTPSSASRNSQRLMWSSANGNAMRIHFTPGATVSVWPVSGSALPSG
ncbi:hypothetical protein Y695_04323 [Hydrogenophaga sp. T4]|nr:hypothetical protein Y695_04323 [Hydrogenophaga sp. T4]